MNIDSYAKKIPSPDDLLAYVGLQRRDNTLAFQALGLLTGGVLLGLAAGLLLAPKAGSELRADLLSAGEKVRDQVRLQAQATQGHAERMAPSTESDPSHNGDSAPKTQSGSVR